MSYDNLEIKLIQILGTTSAASCMFTVKNAREKYSPIKGPSNALQQDQILPDSVGDARLMI